MWRKVVWLFVWMTLAMWSGCAGENQNYKINEQDTPIFQEGYPTQTMPGTHNDQAAPQQPALTSLDRSHWPMLTISPATAIVLHHPVYFTTECCGRPVVRHRDRPSPLRRDGDPERQAHAATAGARANYRTEDVCDMLTCPLKFSYDLALWPVHAALAPPWGWQTSSADRY